MKSCVIGRSARLLQGMHVVSTAIKFCICLGLALVLQRVLLLPPFYGILRLVKGL